MGTEARIVLHAQSRALADSAASAALDRIARIDRALSDYRVDSELAAVAAAAGTAPVPVGYDLVRVLRFALDLARETDGAFDPTAGPVTLLWREARRTGRMPVDAAVARAASLVGWTRVSVDSVARTVRLDTAGMRLDLGAVAKGFAADEALAVLRDHGTPRALVTLGGEIVAGQPPPGETGWRVLVEHADPTHRSLRIANAALSSSGDAEQFIDLDGVHHSHVLDPRSGRPLTDHVTATVLAPNGMAADAFATVVTVLDSADRAAFVAGHPAARFYVRRMVH